MRSNSTELKQIFLNPRNILKVINIFLAHQKILNLVYQICMSKYAFIIRRVQRGMQLLAYTKLIF